MMGVKALPEAARSSMRSGVVLYDLTSVVEELVFNSLDAGATKVSVFIGVGTCYVKVVDDGCGITRDGLVLVGERYATSKFDRSTELDAATGSFGFRGEALASISDVSLFEILTKASGRPNGYRKVMKGCKCLYLGIDDDRKDVGTTVIVRDLFYNQPVRRKYMQSSPKKVLHSVNKCVHRIALVHSKVSFKVVDIESEDELLCTIRSPSSLTLLKRTFGTDVCAALEELNISEGKLELSGFISSSCNSLTIKAFQYIYINSRFISKGPIHKLLNQLASSFECWDSGKVVDGSQNRKRSRPQAYPAYVLNLSCPRSFYDLTFEPSKTCVEFKDWVPVLTFIDKVIKNFWKEKISDGRTGCHGVDMVGGVKIWKEGDNIVSAEKNLVVGDLSECSEFGRKKSRIQDHQPSPDLMELLIKEDSNTSQKRRVRTPYGNLHTSTEDFKGFKDQHAKIEFGHHTDYSFQSPDHIAKFMLTATPKKESHPWMSDINFLSEEDYIMERSTTAERSSSVENNILSSAWQDDTFKVDPRVGNGSAGTGVSCDHHEVSKDVEFTKDLVQPFLKSCSSKFVPPTVGYGSAGTGLSFDHQEFCNDVEFTQNLEQPFLKSCLSKGRFLSERDLCTESIDGRIKFQSCDFGSKRRWDGSYDSVDIPEIDGSKNFDFLSRSLWPEEESSAQCFPRVTKFDRSTEFETLSGAFIKSIPHHGEHFGGESSIINVDNIGSCHKTLDNEWCPVTSSPLSENTYLDFGPISKKYAVKGCSRSAKRATNKYFLDFEEKDYRFGSNILSKTSSLEQCNTPTDGGNFNDYAGSMKFLQQHNFIGVFSPERSDILADEADWSSWYSCSKDNTGIDMNKTKRDQFQYQDCLKNLSIGRSKRSHSAPPICRGKKKYFTLNYPLTTTARKPDAQAFHVAATYPEASKMMDFHQCPGGFDLHLKPSSVKDFSSETRPEIKMLEAKMFEESQCSEIQTTVPIKEFCSQDQDSLNTKWRNCCPQITNISKRQGLHDEITILDVSSGFLHLASDSLVPESIKKNCLKDCRVLQQVDKKFIAVMAGRTLAVIDQHAADERIRLEELRQKVLSGEEKKITFLDVEQELVLPEIGYQLLHNYAKTVEDWGWLCNIHAESSRSFKRNLNLLHRQSTVISLIAVPCILGVSLSDSDLMEFLQQLADTDGSSTMPPSVLRILNSKACRGAIMFGDSLLPSECSLIIDELKQTSLCFQCAHGRPTTAPLVNLEALHKHIAKTASLSDGADQLWHGLGQQELSLARAEQRLRLARS